MVRYLCSEDLPELVILLHQFLVELSYSRRRHVDLSQARLPVSKLKLNGVLTNLNSRHVNFVLVL